MAPTLYNEIDPFAAQWLRNLIGAGHLAGEVIECDVRTLHPSAVSRARRFHAFAGIGCWEYALQLAGWPDSVPTHTGSCPCQPFSAAGRQRGFDDERHLWPAWRRLIDKCRPTAVFGEQVASPLGRNWLDAVSADLEALGYVVGAADLCAAGVGAPHIRQRLYFVAIACSDQLEKQCLHVPAWRQNQTLAEAPGSSKADLLGHPNSSRPQERQGPQERQRSVRQQGTPAGSPSTVRGFWADCEWLACTDGKWRATEPGVSPLVDRTPARVGRLRGYGNAIVPQVAASFVRATMDAIGLP